MAIEWHPATEDDWQACSARAGFVPLQQSLAYGRAMAGLGAGVRPQLLRRDGVVIGMAQVLTRRGLWMLPRGPVWCEAVAAQDQRRALRRLARRVGVLVATPEQPVAGFGVLPLITSRHQAIWDLAPDPVALRNGLARDWRARLRQAEASGVTVRHAGQSALNALITAEAAQRKARNYRALPSAFLDHWPGPRQIWEWRQGGQVQAAMLFLRHGAAATYHLAWANDTARQVGAHRLMLWQAALALRADGVRWLDLGDVSADAPGLARFKQGTGAALHRLGATVWILPG